jgi:hypothetical protein
MTKRSGLALDVLTGLALPRRISRTFSSSKLARPSTLE